MDSPNVLFGFMAAVRIESDVMLLMTCEYRQRRKGRESVYIYAFYYVIKIVRTRKASLIDKILIHPSGEEEASLSYACM